MNPQDNQQGQERQQSSIDRINNLARKGKSTYKNLRRARTAISTTRTAISAARAGAAAAQGVVSAASNPIGVVVLIIAIILLTLFIVIIGGGGTIQSSEEIDSPGSFVSLPNGVGVEVRSPAVGSDRNISYNIEVTITPSELEVDVNDLILTFLLTYEHSFISDAPNNDDTRQGELGKAYIWNFSSHPQPDNVFNFELVVDPTPIDFVAEAYLAVGTTIPNLDTLQTQSAPIIGGGGIMTGADSPPTATTCGQYGGYMNAIKADFLK